MIRGAALAAVIAASACGRIGFGLLGDGGSQPGGDGAIPPTTSCRVPPLPDTSAPDHVIGDGTATDCTEAALRAAVGSGGVIVLNCGSAASIGITAGELAVTAPTTVISGPGVSLTANGLSRAIHAMPGVQSLALVGLTIIGGATPESGAGVFIETGALSVFASSLQDNDGPVSDPQAGGGAIAATAGASIAVYDSILSGNEAANGGAILALSALTIVDSSLSGNTATGSGGSSGIGGLGGAIDAVGVADDAFCGVTLADNHAGSLGGGIVRISTDGTGTDRWERSTIVDNMAGDGAGGMYVQDVALALDRVTIADNSSSNVGGLWYVGSAGPFTATQIEITGNTGTSGLGAGLELGGAPGTIAFSTIAFNNASCATCWAAAIDGGTAGMTLTSSVIDDNVVEAPSEPISCATPVADGGGNFQWPADPSNALCAPGAQAVDAQLGREAIVSGPDGNTYIVDAPAAGSPVIGAATSCPAIDLVGNPRPTPCAAGAVEP